jgi:hypothetical protein
LERLPFRKVVGVLEGTGGIADQIKEIAALASKPAGSDLVFESNPEALIDICLRVLAGRN